MAVELSELLAPVVGALGLELVDVRLRPGTVAVVVDRAGGVDLDALTEATRAVSAVLDRNDPVAGGHYTLEVTSPGLERQLVRPEHFARAVGENVSVRTLPDSGLPRRVGGRLAASGTDGITIESDELPDGRLEVPFGAIERARTVFEWGPSSRPPASGRTATGGKAGHRRERIATP